MPEFRQAVSPVIPTADNYSDANKDCEVSESLETAPNLSFPRVRTPGLFCCITVAQILCQAASCPEPAPDVVRTEGVRYPREAGKHAWGRTAQRGADENC
jgi:hypothetical protein